MWILFVDDDRCNMPQVSVQKNPVLLPKPEQQRDLVWRGEKINHYNKPNLLEWNSKEQKSNYRQENGTQ